MNVRKPADYNALFMALDELIAANLPQMELYCEIGRLVSGRQEKGAAVASAEYLHRAYPDVSGFSPRNLRRMRDFYRTYEDAPEIMAEAMAIGWTQNVVILEAELTLQERAWYIRVVRQFDWSKLKLAERIGSSTHLEMALDLSAELCYTEKNGVTECASNDEHPFYLPQQHMSKPNGRICNEGSGEEGRAGSPVPHRVRRHQHRGDRQPSLSPSPQEAGRARERLRRENGAEAHQQRLRQVQSPGWDGSGQSAEYAPHLRRRFCQQATLADGLHRPPWRCGRPVVHG